MNILSNIFNRFRALYRARYEPENLRPLADMYWRSMLALMLVSIVGVIMFGLWEFVAVVDSLASAQGNANSTPPVALNRPELEATLHAYDARQEQFRASLSAPVTAKDPSR